MGEIGGRLRKGEQFDRVLFELLPVGLALCRMDGILVDVNPAFAAIIGRTVEETLALTYWEITPEKYADQERSQLAALAESGRYGPYEKEYIHKSGRLVPVRLQGRLVEMEGEPFIWSSVEDISELRAATEELRASEEKFRTIYNQAPMGIFRSTLDGRFLGANAAAASLFGYDSPEEFISSVLDISQQIFVRHQQRNDIVREVSKSDGFVRREVEYRRKDGSRFIANLYMRAVRDGQGAIAFLEGFLEDITGRKFLEESLKEKNEQLRIFVEHSPAAVAMLDRDMRYIIASRRWLTDYRLGDQPITGKSHYDLFPEIPERWRDVHRRCLAGAVEKSDEEAFVRADGSTDWIRWEVRPWYANTGAIGGIIIFSEDITPRKRAEEAIRHERDFSAALIDSLPGMMYLFDQNLRFLRWNKNFERVTGYGAEEVSRMSPLDLFAGGDMELIRSRVQEVFGTGASDAEAELVAKDGSRIPFYFTGLRTEIDGQTCLLGVGIDISDRKKAEAQLSRVTRELEERVEERTVDLQRSKLALMNVVDDLNIKTAELAAANEKLMEVDRLKSMFIASMSHELRTPLNSVIGYSSVLLNEWLGTVTPLQKEKLAIVLRAGKHLLSLINDVIDVSKIEAQQVERYVEDFDLFDLLTEAAEQVDSDLRGKGLDFSVQNVHARLRTDRRRLLQAVLNLLSNAVKYTVEGAVRVSAAMEGDWAEIRVCDTGIGISEREAEKIFQPFVRIDSPLKSTVAGTGLGLYLTWKLVTEILRGTIFFTSHTGQGTTFTIRVPVNVDNTFEMGRRG